MNRRQVVKKWSKLKLSCPHGCFCYEKMMPAIAHYFVLSPNDSGLEFEWLATCVFALHNLYQDVSQIPLSSQISLRADDTKCTKIITSPDDQRLLQEDLNQICACMESSLRSLLRYLKVSHNSLL